jgi:hypothetical protein
MLLTRCFDGNRYGLSAFDKDSAECHGLASSIIYAMQRHHETGKPYLCGIYGHVMVDCKENRKTIRSLCDDVEGIAAVTKLLNNHTFADKQCQQTTNG